MLELAKALSSQTRLEILRILSIEPMHISGVAKMIDISVPVTARHVSYLEKAGLIKRRKYGRTHILELENLDNLVAFTDGLIEHVNIEVEENTDLLEALQKTSAIEYKKTKEGSLLISLDGDKGYYVYEVDGKTPRIPIGKYRIRKDSIVKLKKLVPTTRKAITIKVMKRRKGRNQGNQ